MKVFGVLFSAILRVFVAATLMDMTGIKMFAANWRVEMSTNQRRDFWKKISMEGSAMLRRVILLIVLALVGAIFAPTSLRAQGGSPGIVPLHQTECATAGNGTNTGPLKCPLGFTPAKGNTILVIGVCYAAANCSALTYTTGTLRHEYPPNDLCQSDSFDCDSHPVQVIRTGSGMNSAWSVGYIVSGGVELDHVTLHAPASVGSNAQEYDVIIEEITGASLTPLPLVPSPSSSNFDGTLTNESSCTTASITPASNSFIVMAAVNTDNQTAVSRSTSPAISLQTFDQNPNTGAFHRLNTASGVFPNGGPLTASFAWYAQSSHACGVVAFSVAPMTLPGTVVHTTYCDSSSSQPQPFTTTYYTCQLSATPAVGNTLLIFPALDFASHGCTFASIVGNPGGASAYIFDQGTNPINGDESCWGAASLAVTAPAPTSVTISYPGATPQFRLPDGTLIFGQITTILEVTGLGPLDTHATFHGMNNGTSQCSADLGGTTDYFQNISQCTTPAISPSGPGEVYFAYDPQIEIDAGRPWLLNAATSPGFPLLLTDNTGGWSMVTALGVQSTTQAQSTTFTWTPTTYAQRPDLGSTCHQSCGAAFFRHVSRAEVCGRAAAGIDCAISNGSSFGGAFLANPNFSDAQFWNSSSVYYGSLRMADVNGDGIADVCGRAAAGIQCSLGNGDGTFRGLQQWDTFFSDAGGWNSAAYGTTIMFGDINGDGKADVCGRASAGIVCELSNGSSFGGSFIATINFSDAQGWNGNSSYYGSLRMADVNGDGKADICGRASAGVQCVLSNGDGTFGGLVQWDTFFSDAGGWNPAPYGTTIMFGDINGDGKADVCGRASAGIACELSNGSNFAPAFMATINFSDAQGWNGNSSYYGSLRMADVNGDGKADICGRASAGIQCVLSNGDGTFGGLQQWDTFFSDAGGWNPPPYGTTIMFGLK